MDQDIVREGILQKRNVWFWKQDRHFILHKNGLLSYYSDGTAKGMILLNKYSKVDIIQEGQFDLTVREGRVYHLFCKPQAVKQWVQDIRAVVAGL